MKSKYLNLVWGLVLIVAGGMFLSQGVGVISELPSQVWTIVFAGLSLLCLASYLINGVERWGWLFPACISGALAVTVGLGEAGVSSAAVGVPIPASIALPFVVAFALNTRRNWWALIPAWVMAVLATVILITERMSGEAMAIFIMLCFAMPFLIVYVVDRRRWWALIPCGVFCFNAVVVLVATQAVGAWVETLVVFLIALPSLVAYLWSPRSWWALIPAGVLISVGIVVLSFIGDRLVASRVGWINGFLFLGWAVTFAMLWMRRATQPTSWAKYPAIGLAVVAILSLVLDTDIGRFWPVVPIAAGIGLLWAGLRPTQAKPGEENAS
jgi:hypothetical protein